MDWKEILIILLFIGFIVYSQNKSKKKHKSFSYTQLKKYVGVYSFWKQYYDSWEQMHNFLDLLKRYDIHYIRIWLITPEMGKFANPYKKVGDYVFDLSQYDENYFKEMHKFLQHAQDNEIVVMINVFDDCHIRHHIKNCPETRNINGIKNEHDWYYKPEARKFAKMFIDKIANEFNKYPNVIFAVCNENYDYPEWQADMTRYMYGKLKQLDSGGSVVPDSVRNLYSTFTHHDIVSPNQVNGSGENHIYSSDGGHWKRIEDIEPTVDKACQVGKGFELYVGGGSGNNWDIIPQLKILQRVSKKYNGF